jgi:hypothetical protein
MQNFPLTSISFVPAAVLGAASNKKNPQAENLLEGKDRTVSTAKARFAGSACQAALRRRPF